MLAARSCGICIVAWRVRNQEMKAEYAYRLKQIPNCIAPPYRSDSFMYRFVGFTNMADVKLTRRGRRHVKSIQRSRTRFELQKVATEIQNEVERRALTYDEAINIGNILQNHADMLPGDEIIYAISDRDAYRKTVELYLKDAILTRTEQLLLWEERRRLGITDEEHNRLMQQLLATYRRLGKNVTVHGFVIPTASDEDEAEDDEDLMDMEDDVDA